MCVCVCVDVFVGGGGGVYACARTLRIVSLDKILRFINTLNSYYYSDMFTIRWRFFGTVPSFL